MCSCCCEKTNLRVIFIPFLYKEGYCWPIHPICVFSKEPTKHHSLLLLTVGNTPGCVITDVLSQINSGQHTGAGRAEKSCWAKVTLEVELVCVCVCAAAKSHLSCPTLCDPMDCIAHQAPLWHSQGKKTSMLPFPTRDLPDPGIEPMSHISCIGRWVLDH